MIKFNRSAICKDAWFHARCLAKRDGIPVRAALGAGFKTAWSIAKLHVALASAPRAVAAPAVRREERATPPQIAYIARLGGTCPLGTTKRAASAMITHLLATKRSRVAPAPRYAEEPYSAEEAHRLRRIRAVHGAIID